MASKESARHAASGNRAAPVIADRSWLVRVTAGSAAERADRERLARALGRATARWEEAKRCVRINVDPYRGCCDCRHLDVSLILSTSTMLRYRRP